MEILKAEFVKGIVGGDFNLKDSLPQVAFLGRSNVGKSSAINSLTNRKNLVKTSKVPGKTTEANFFRINDSFYFVDFPGYGYAKRSIKQRNKMAKRILWYIRDSSMKPRAVFLIIDIKAGLTDLDREIIGILKENNHQIVIIANRIDKMGKLAVERQINSVRKQEPNISVFPYSAKTKKGRDELIRKIADIIKV